MATEPSRCSPLYCRMMLIAMITAIMTMIPNLFAAAALLGITYFVGKFAASSVSLLLKGMGFDGLPAKLGCTF